MKSRKILVVALIGLLVVSFLGPVVALCQSGCNNTDQCTIQDWMEWLVQYLLWLMGRPDGPPPVPYCLP